jgi:cytoskeletal protein RodZ
MRVDLKPPTSVAGRPRSADEPVHHSTRASFGPVLKRERQQRGISLDDVARGTRVARRYLLALENESLNDLPGGPYNRAYLRAYAEYLGLDAKSLVREYETEAQAQCQGGRLAAEPDAVVAMRTVIQRGEWRTAGGPNAVKTTTRLVILRGTALGMLVGAMWLGTRVFTRSAETLPAKVSNPSALVTSEGGKKPIEVSAMASELAHQTEPEVPQSDSKPAARVQGITAETAPPNKTPPAASLSVNDSGVGTDVIDRQLVGRADTFAVGTRVAFWMLVTGGRSGDTVRHVWVHQGQTVATFTLSIGSASWRTQSRRTLAPGAEGDWVVEAHDTDGRVLARHAFRCEP